MIENKSILMRHRANRMMGWKECWVSFSEAARLYDNGFIDVEIGEWIVDFNSESIRAVTDKDKQEISRAADEYSGSK